ATACCIINSSACSRVVSHISSNSVMFPPTSVSNDAPIVPNMLRDRTVIPRTNPIDRATRYPGSSNAVVIMFSFPRTSIIPPRHPNFGPRVCIVPLFCKLTRCSSLRVLPSPSNPVPRTIPLSVTSRDTPGLIPRKARHDRIIRGLNLHPDWPGMGGLSKLPVYLPQCPTTLKHTVHTLHYFTSPEVDLL